ncbi:MAG: hydrolase [Treponemataceae bacterium]|nr:MAG: hydrolase [Treponemataceae bacterium]
MKFADAEMLLKKYVAGETLLRHSYTVAVTLDYWAKDSGEADAETWRCIGLLHDLDFEKYPAEHCIKAKEILEAEKDCVPGITRELIHAIQSHGWELTVDVKPESYMEKVLYTVDELTGIIYASALMRPSKSVADMEVKSVLKKYKTPAFAAGCSRDVINKGCGLLGMELSAVIEKTLSAMRSEAALLGV